MTDFENYLVYGVIAFLVIGGVYTFWENDTNVNDANAKVAPNIKNNDLNGYSGFAPVLTGTTGEGDVEISLTPVVDGSVIKIQIAANTHSVDLSQFDLMKIIKLVYENKKISPVSAPKLSGHHANGELVFNLEKEINSFAVTIEGIPKINERLFKW